MEVFLANRQLINGKNQPIVIVCIDIQLEVHPSIFGCMWLCPIPIPADSCIFLLDIIPY